MRENVIAFFLLYARPLTAISRIIDQGKLWFALLAALAVSLLLHATDPAVRGFGSAVFQFISFTPGSYFAALLALAALFVPAILLCRALFGFGSFSVLMNSDYLSLLVCVLM